MTDEEKEIAAIKASGAEACCKEPSNLSRKVEAEGLVINTCTACGRRHFRATTEEGIRLGLAMTSSKGVKQ